MREYKYKVSVIVPVYNVEEYIRPCLDSLAAQTIDHSQIEVLLINDGSTDRSLEICYEYAQSEFIFKVFDKENEGVSATRNFGIRNASGKYIMFLDSDDTYTPNTVKLVTDFFDKHYDEVDLVSYYEAYYNDGKQLAPHPRYKYLTKTGVYDLDKTIFAMQVNINFAIKNHFEENLLYDESMPYQEDQKYCCHILSNKLKLGFVKEAQYNYLKNSSSVVMSSTNVITFFDKTIEFFEELFASYPEQVPEYYQALFIHDCSWKLKQHCLFPYHYTGEEFERQNARLIALMKRIDIDVLMKSPTIDNFHRYYFLKFICPEDIMVYPESEQISVLYRDKVIRTEQSCEIICNKLRHKGDKFIMLATFKSMYGSFVSKPSIYAVEKGTFGTKERKIESFFSSDSYYKAREKTNTFWSFYYETDMKFVSSFELIIEVGGVRYPARYYFMPNTPLSSASKRKTTLMGDFSLKFEENVFSINPIDESAKFKLISNNTALVKDKVCKSIRNEVIKSLDKRIWLYYDCKDVKGDNGYYQFENDCMKDDGVERYYISNNPPDFMREYVKSELQSRVVLFGSIKHKILFVSAEKILTAFIEPYNYNPLTGPEYAALSDLIHYELIYLQHGILHATLPWKYTPERSLADKIVVSSYFEKENFKNNYNFRECDILPTGMGRFSRIAPKSEGEGPRKILFAPTWRQYLIGQAPDGSWIPEERKFTASTYFEHFNDFLNSERLAEALEEHDCILEVKMHPIFEVYEELFQPASDRIKMVTSISNQRDYDMFITDFSSFTFDFAYCKLPIMYFVPDMYEFNAGLNQYRKLDLPFEKAFGRLVTDADGAVDEVISVIDRDFVPEPEYQKRMDEFYLPMEDCCGKLYDILINE